VKELIKSAQKLNAEKLKKEQWLNDQLINFFGNVYKLTLGQFLRHPLLICETYLF